MPYEIENIAPGQWALRNKDTGKVKSVHDTKEKAMAAMRAIMAAEHGGEMMKGGGK